MLFLYCSQNVGKFFLLKSGCNALMHIHSFEEKDIGNLVYTLCIIDTYLKTINQKIWGFPFLSAILLYTALVLKV